jgi:hypothetical protein
MEQFNHRNLSKKNITKFINFCLLFFDGYSKIRISKNGTVCLRKSKFSLFNRTIKINFYKLIYEIIPLEISFRRWNSQGLAPTITKMIMDIIVTTYSTDNSKFESILALFFKEVNGATYYNLRNSSFDFSKMIYSPTLKLESKRLKKTKEQENKKVVTGNKLLIVHNSLENSGRIKRIKRSVISAGIAATLIMALTFNTVNLLKLKNYLHMLKPHIEQHSYCQYATKETIFDSS